jgi:predicted transcriptional regulator
MLSPVYFFSKIGIEMPEDLAREMEDMRRLRNLAAHGRIDPTQEGVIRSIATVERFEQFIDSIDKIKIKHSVQKFMEERKKNDRKPIIENNAIEGGPQDILCKT